MAAIVSQLAAANRRRKANKKNNIPIDKSVYVLPPFDPCFRPEVHNRYMRQKQAHLAHQEFMSRIGNVSPVHMHQLDQLASLRIKSRRPIAIPDPIREELEQIESGFKDRGAPKRGASAVVCARVTSRPNCPAPAEDRHEEEEATRAELRPMMTSSEDEISRSRSTTLESSSQHSTSSASIQIGRENSKSANQQRSVKCQIVIAVLGCLAFIPLFGIVIYLVGMFYGVPKNNTS